MGVPLYYSVSFWVFLEMRLRFTTCTSTPPEFKKKVYLRFKHDGTSWVFGCLILGGWYIYLYSYIWYFYLYLWLILMVHAGNIYHTWVLSYVGQWFCFGLLGPGQVFSPSFTPFWSEVLGGLCRGPWWKTLRFSDSAKAKQTVGMVQGGPVPFIDGVTHL